MTKYEIIEQLARERRVERMAENIARRAYDADLADLSQIVYLILLEYDDDKIVDLWENEQIDYFLARVIHVQYYGVRTAYYNAVRKFSRRTDELTER